MVSKYRPRCPIITISRNKHTARVCHLYRGCYPLYFSKDRDEGGEWQEDVDSRILWAMDQARGMGLLKPGMEVVAVQGWKQGVGFTNTMRILTVPE